MYCFDANVWIYYFDERLPEHEPVADNVDPILRERSLFTTTVLQMEVLHYLHRSLGSRQHADEFLEIDRAAVASLQPADVQRSNEILEEFGELGIGGRDATVVATLERHGVSALLTHDTALLELGDELEWLTVIDPVTA
jgi:predicted nucleic acid-binding protein